MLAGAWRCLAAYLGALFLIASSEAYAQKRVALVIGNSSYQNTALLPNPVRDAQAVADLFKNAGFDTVQDAN
jgi:caspase domain-containing protein